MDSYEELDDRENVLPLKLKTMQSCVMEYLNHLRCPDPSVSPLSDWLLEAHSVSKWLIGEFLEELRGGPNPAETVWMIKDLESGRGDPTSPEYAELFQIMRDHFGMPADLVAKQATWFEGRRGKR